MNPQKEELRPERRLEHLQEEQVATLELIHLGIHDVQEKVALHSRL